LTKAQSLGEVLDSPIRIQSISAPSTPSRTPNRTHPIPDSLFLNKSPVSDQSRPLLAGDTVEGSEGKTRKTYGRMRSYLDVDGAERPADVENAEDRQTYAELRDRYEVNNTGDSQLNLLPVSWSLSKLTCRTGYKHVRLSQSQI
jgi:hypothetical protein